MDNCTTYIAVDELRNQNRILQNQNELLIKQNELLKKHVHVSEQTLGWFQQIALDLRKS